MRRLTHLALVTALILLGFALRLYQINHVPLRGDEAFTVIHWVREPLAQTIANIATIDPQAPLSYALFRGWGMLTGTTEFTVRYLPALLNLLGVPVLYALGKRLGGGRLGYVAALFWAIHPYQIWHAQDARNYAIWAALSPLAAWLALRALDKHRRLDWLLYVLAAATAGYIYYLELFALVVLNLFVFITHWRDRRLLIQWIGSQIAIGLLLAPWYLQERLLFGSGYGGTTGRLDPPLWLTWFVPTLTFGETLPPELKAVLWIALLLALIVGWVVLWRRKRQLAIWLGLLGTLPLLFLGIVSTKLNVFTPRYVLTAAPAYTLLLAVLIVYLPIRAVPMRRIVSVALCIAILAVSGLSLYHYYFVPETFKSPDWRALASYLNTHTQADDLVIQAAADEAFTFYFNEYAVAGDLIYLPANPRQPADEIEMVLAEQTAAHRSTWYVAEPPDWTNRAVPLAWLNAELQQVRHTSVPRLPIAQFMPWAVANAASEPLAVFADINGTSLVELVSYDLWREPDGHLTVWLDWRPLTASAEALKSFVHVLSAVQPQPVTQDDQFPQDGRLNALDWPLNAVYRDVYTLPLTDVVTGEYQIAIGWYNPDTGVRLTTDQADHVALETLTLP
ncbi:MAG: glycosyltransferase family 39 protein [Chloroflexi bacterium]|uniref:glycosyltransferase family 39 protein n=1 Tax=Candidatus Flexifilum breve TaxID=3140694 RepID=UPI0031355380|nr:glycosyltransferase family 39 protein [Chloroflexota bacterium]